MSDDGTPDVSLDIGEELDLSDYADDFTFWLSIDQTMGTAYRGKATWRLGQLGKRPHIAAKFTLKGQTYQMRLYPNRDACGPAAIVIDRELKKQALLDAKKYNSWEPDDAIMKGGVDAADKIKRS